MTDYFVRFGRRHGEFDVEAGTTTLVPKTFVLKRIVSVFLEAATSTIEADALLQDLRQIEKFQDLALEQLRRNYLLWHRDEDFPQKEIHFSGSSSSALLHRPRPRAALLHRVPAGEHPLGDLRRPSVHILGLRNTSPPSVSRNSWRRPKSRGSTYDFGRRSGDSQIFRATFGRQ